MVRQVAHDQRMKALDDFLESYKAQHGVITNEDMAAATRRARSRAVVVREPSPKHAGRAKSPRRGER
jgi:hypothetical protein